MYFNQIKIICLFISLLLNLQFSNILAQSNDRFETGRANFMLQMKNIVSPYRISSVFLLPGDTLELQTIFQKEGGKCEIEFNQGNLISATSSSWKWIAPDTKGAYPLVVRADNESDSILLNCIVMVPANRKDGEMLNGYRIGQYPTSQKQVYRKPPGFIEVTKENQDLQLTPHFRLGQFIAKQESGYPKYVVLSEKLLFKLEYIMQKLDDSGHDIRRLTVMSGYRTPFYNKLIGNVQFSRHVYGDACDIFVDNNQDYIIDDLNGDGLHDVKDARILYDLIDGLQEDTWYKPFIGGLGLYRENNRRTAFVHTDVRGYPARWSQ
jgi:hypothetical protein